MDYSEEVEVIGVSQVSIPFEELVNVDEDLKSLAETLGVPLEAIQAVQAIDEGKSILQKLWKHLGEKAFDDREQLLSKSIIFYVRM